MYGRLVTICLMFAAGAIALNLGGPAGTPADFRYLNRNGINTLDPAQISWSQDIRVALNLWEGLTAFDPKTTVPTPGAAYFPPDVSDDGLVYTFHLRPDAIWSNGDPLTAEDFVRGWRRAIEPGTAGDYAVLILDRIAGARTYYEWRLAGVKALTELWTRYESGDADAIQRHDHLHASHASDMDRRFRDVGIRALDDRRLLVTLVAPCGYFLDLCAFVTFLPCHESIELLRHQFAGRPLTPEGLVSYDPQWSKPNYHENGYPGLITNGPFQLSEWTFKRRLRMTANPYYWDAANVSLHTIDAVVYDDLNTALMAYEAGQLDFLTDMQVDYDHELYRLAREGLRTDFHAPPVFGTYFYIFNCADPTYHGRVNPFTDARVRKAFALAINKEALVSKVVGRGDPVSNHIIPVDSISGYPSAAAAGYDPDLARRLLAQAGYPDGRGLPTIEILYNTGYQHGKVSEVLAQMWQDELGAAISLIGKEAKTFADDKVHQRFMIARAGWYGDYGDPTTFLEIFATGNGNNDAGFSSPEFDALLTEAAITRDHKRRMQLLAQAEGILVQEEFPALVLYQYTNLLAISPRVSGIYPNPRLMFPFKGIRVER